MGLCKWVLTTPELKDWRLADASTKATTLWLTGLPGVGKSCISAYLGELLPRQYSDDLVLSFFCKRESPGLNTVFSIIKTLCYQLMRADGFCRKFLQETLDLPKTNSKDDILFLVDKLLRKPITAGPGEQTIFILLDGPDELEDVSHTPKGLPSAKSEAESFLEQLITIPRLKVLVTSRRQPQLASVLSSCGAVRQIKPVDNAHDIQHYVAHRVSASPALQRGFSEMKTDPLEYFASRANGVFLWVSAVLDILERAVSTKAFKNSLETTHPTMSSIYDDIFQRAEKRGSIGLINEVLNWTAVPPSPLTVHQMALAVEFSGGDRVLGMGKFPRTECGAFLGLVPRLGSSNGMPAEDSIEVHIGHETFQAWLADRKRNEPQLAHGKAAAACLKYLLSGCADLTFKPYALERWRWHLRHSMGVGDHHSAGPAPQGGSPMLPTLATTLFLHLYRFLSQQEAGDWIEVLVDNENYDRKCFWEVHYTYQDVSMWCQINRATIVDEALKDLGLDPTALSRLTKWRDTLDNPQVIARMLWPRVCRAFLWSSNPDPSPAYWSSGVLHALHIYAFGKRLSEERAETGHLLDVEQDLATQNASPKATGKQYGALRGTLTTHFANVMLQVGTIDTRIQSREIAEDCLDAVKKAGRYDDLSGVCAYNVSVFLYEMVCHRRVPPGDELHVLRAAMDAVEEAIADDPEGFPRNYCHLGDIYRHLRWADGADTEEHSRKVIQTYQ